MVIGRAAMAGLVGTAVMSILGRMMPVSGSGGGEGGGGTSGKSSPPQDPFDREAVREWQMQAQAPAAHRQERGGSGGSNRGGGGGGNGSQGGATQVTPAGALAQAQSSGPEGIASQFAYKLGNGLFVRDIRQYRQVAGEAVHFTYGPSWAILYGLYQSSYRKPPTIAGALFGLLVWAFGPGWLVPAMKLMLPPTKLPPMHLAMFIVGHVVYGLVVAITFKALEERA